MKIIVEIEQKKIPVVRIDPALDKYENVILFQDKLAKANAQLKKSGIPKIDDKK